MLIKAEKDFGEGVLVSEHDAGDWQGSWFKD